MKQLVAGGMNGIGDPVDPVLGQGPISRVDTIYNSREEGRVVAGPQLWTEDDVSELCAVGDLSLLAIVRVKREPNLHRHLLPGQADWCQG